MSKGTIISGGTNGLYSVSIDRENGSPISDQAYCADLTEDLSGEVGVIEIAGDWQKGVNIQPGYEGNAAYNASRDGNLFEVPQAPAKEGHQAGVYWDWAMRPGWQKWKPNYRYGTITEIDYDADTCSVSLEACLSTDMPDGAAMDINQTDSLSGIPIEYMNCNAAAFEVGDEVVVKFEGNEWSGAKVIGFKEEPKGCGFYILLILGTMCTVLTTDGNIATDVRLDGSGEFATFPCLLSSISEWIAELDEKTANTLFDKESDYNGISSPPTTPVTTYDASGGECEPSCPNDNWWDTTTTNTYSATRNLPDLFGGNKTFNYSRVHTLYETSGCGPCDDFCTSNCGFQSSYGTDVLNRSYNNKLGFILTPKNGGSGEIQFWRQSTLSEQIDQDFGDYTEDEGPWFIASASKSIGYAYGGNEAYLTPPGESSMACSAECDGGEFHPGWGDGGLWDNDCVEDWNYVPQLNDPPYECTPEEDPVVLWPNNIKYVAHYINEEDTKLMTQFFYFIHEEDYQAYVSIGTDPEAEPASVSEKAEASTALVALLQACPAPGPNYYSLDAKYLK